MSLKEIKRLAERIKVAALSERMPTIEAENILIWVGQIERLCEKPAPQVINERADVGNLIEKLWPEAPQEIKSNIMGPINGNDWIGETVEEMEKAILRTKAEYQDHPWTYGNKPPQHRKKAKPGINHRCGISGK